jgi:hypothetical protein
LNDQDNSTTLKINELLRVSNLKKEIVVAVLKRKNPTDLSAGFSVS